jgi:hypothetical protein
MDKKKNNIGRTPDRNTFRNSGEGVNRVSSPSLMKQSNDTKGVEVDPIFSAGKKSSLMMFGKLMLNDSIAVMT